MRWKVFVLFLVVVCTISACAPSTTPIPAPATTSAPVATPTPVDAFFGRRQEMVDRTIAPRDIADPDVLRVMRTVPRHLFVPSDYLDEAYDDHPLPIGYGQTISQPYMVAWMTDLLDLEPGERVLEIGTGSGYQAAVLAELGYVDVYSIEIIPELAEQAAGRLEDLGYGEVHVKQGDGYFGWEEYAPFDAIIVTAAPDHLPAPLVAQLEDGGRLVIPIGPRGGWQVLWRFVKDGDELKAEELGWCTFVPFTGYGEQQPGPGPRP